jgi:alpha-L-rhamnosidase
LIKVTDLLGQINKVLGFKATADKYASQAVRMRLAYQSDYITSSGRVVSDSQTAIVIAIQFELFATKEQEQLAGKRLNQIIRSKARFKIATGFAGTPILGHALTKVRQTQLFYRMLLHKKNPSWLYPVTMGATTIWERWDSMREDGSINPGEMTSFNHYALGAVADWMHKNIGGLQALEPGWKRFLVRPEPGGTVTSSTCLFNSPYGKISCQWKIEQGNFSTHIVVPPNTTAEIQLPGEKFEAISVGSGEYNFCISYVKPDWPPLPIYPPYFPHDDDEP